MGQKTQAEKLMNSKGRTFASEHFHKKQLSAKIRFDATYPANKSRKILKSLLEQAGICSIFDYSSSFDRLFPNQDYLSGKGLGNLIALPFHRPAFNKGYIFPGFPD